MPNSPEFYATTPISMPVIVPEAEDAQMNGFAWSSDFGMLVAFGDSADAVVDELQRLRRPIEQIRTHGQGLREDG